MGLSRYWVLPFPCRPRSCYTHPRVALHLCPIPVLLCHPKAVLKRLTDAAILGCPSKSWRCIEAGWTPRPPYKVCRALPPCPSKPLRRTESGLPLRLGSPLYNGASLCLGCVGITTGSRRQPCFHRSWLRPRSCSIAGVRCGGLASLMLTESSCPTPPIQSAGLRSGSPLW